MGQRRDKKLYDVNEDNGSSSSLHQLTPERETRLTNLGFIWKFDQACWYAYYCQLTEFQKRYGHCNVPTNYKPNPNLSVWCKLQRKQYKRMIIEKKKQRLMMQKLKRSIKKKQQQQRQQQQQQLQLQTAAAATRLLPLITAVTAGTRTTGAGGIATTTSTTNYITLLRMSKLNEIGFCWNPRNIR